MNLEYISKSPIYLSHPESGSKTITNYLLYETIDGNFEVRTNINLVRAIYQFKEMVLIVFGIIFLNILYFFGDEIDGLPDLSYIYFGIIVFLIAAMFLLISIFFMVYRAEKTFLIDINTKSRKITVDETEFNIKKNDILNLIKNYDDEVSIYHISKEEIHPFLDYSWKYDKTNDFVGVVEIISELMEIDFNPEIVDIQLLEDSHPDFFTEYHERIVNEEMERAEFNHRNRFMALALIILISFCVVIMISDYILNQIENAPISLLHLFPVLTMIAILTYYLLEKQYHKSEKVRSFIHKFQNSLINRDMKFGEEK